MAYAVSGVWKKALILWGARCNWRKARGRCCFSSCLLATAFLPPPCDLTSRQTCSSGFNSGEYGGR